MSDMEKCIMPEMPYCPACKYGNVVVDENSAFGMTEWICLYDPEQSSVFAD